MSFIKDAMIYIGYVISLLIPVKSHSRIFFFFPFYHTGGAEKVHADIVLCFKELKPLVFFTNRSEDKRYKDVFSSSARIFDLWVFTYAFSFLVGLLSGYINRHEKAIVFGCNNVLYYHVLPRLRPSIRKVDLIHAFGGGIEWISLGVVPKIDARIVVTTNTRDDLMDQYRKNGIDDKYSQRILVIENEVSVPSHYPEKMRNIITRALYVGRGTEEKRVYIVGKVATCCREKRIPVEFILVGDVNNSVEKNDRKNCKILGKIGDQKKLSSIYMDSDFLILTSDREGFPIVVMEAMGYGVVPICTNVGGISLHVEHGVNGFLIDNSKEDAIVEEIMNTIRLLEADREILGKLSKSAYEYAKKNFSARDFCRKYKNALLAGPWTDGTQ